MTKYEITSTRDGCSLEITRPRQYSRFKLMAFSLLNKSIITYYPTKEVYKLGHNDECYLNGILKTNF